MNNTNIYYIFALIFIIILYLNYDNIDNFFVGVARGKKSAKNKKKSLDIQKPNKPELPTDTRKFRKLKSRLTVLENDKGTYSSSIPKIKETIRNVVVDKKLSNYKKELYKKNLLSSLASQQRKEIETKKQLAKEYEKQKTKVQKEINQLQINKVQKEINQLQKKINSRVIKETKEVRSWTDRKKKLEELLADTKVLNSKTNELKSQKKALNNEISRFKEESNNLELKLVNSTLRRKIARAIEESKDLPFLSRLAFIRKNVGKRKKREALQTKAVLIKKEKKISNYNEV